MPPSRRLKRKQPLAEVFGFPVEDQSEEAERHRRGRLCPYNNKVPNCTKDKRTRPLGVCSLYHADQPTVVCPVRFRQDWLIASHAAEFFFPPSAHWTSLQEVRLDDANGKSAGNIDLVLVSHDSEGKLLDYGSLEVQGVYISGNLRSPFEYYLENPTERADMDWTKKRLYPRADYLSSSRKRLAPQLLFKGGILHSWQRKMAVAVDSGFFAELPPLEPVAPAEAEIAWFIYDLVPSQTTSRYGLSRTRTVYTKFQPALETITTPVLGAETGFLRVLERKLKEKLKGTKQRVDEILDDEEEVDPDVV